MPPLSVGPEKERLSWRALTASSCLYGLTGVLVTRRMVLWFAFRLVGPSLSVAERVTESDSLPARRSHLMNMDKLIAMNCRMMMMMMNSAFISRKRTPGISRIRVYSAARGGRKDTRLWRSSKDNSTTRKCAVLLSLSLCRLSIQYCAAGHDSASMTPKSSIRIFNGECRLSFTCLPFLRAIL